MERAKNTTWHSMKFVKTVSREETKDKIQELLFSLRKKGDHKLEADLFNIIRAVSKLS